MPYKLLLVEDEAALRTVYAEYLRSQGFEIIEAEDGEQAMTQVANNPNIDLILLDILLPKKDGLKVLEEIRANNAYDKTKIYMATMLNNDKVIKQGFELGADGYIIKDTMNPEQLKQEILGALEPKKAN
jgi:CheY-like chemotaxis protein